MPRVPGRSEMRKILSLIVALGVAALVGDLAGASEYGGGGLALPQAAARYDSWGPIGELQIVGEPGMPYAVFDAAGLPVAGGVLDAPFVSMVVPNASASADGALFHVDVGGHVIGVIDPDWNW